MKENQGVGARANAGAAKKHVLVIGQDVLTRTIVAAYCRRRGFQVAQAADLDQALMLAGRRKSSWYALIADHHPERLAVGELLRALEERKARFDRRIVLYADTKIQAAVAKRCRLVPKPLSPEILRTSLDLQSQ